jgi:superfamily II DNA or RNA helicase
VDIPTVDAAMLAASTQSKRQRIQRIGRTLRRGDGRKWPIVITLFARGTGDENVCADGLEDFKGVATIHDESERTCIPRIESLLRGDNG